MTVATAGLACLRGAIVCGEKPLGTLRKEFDHTVLDDRGTALIRLALDRGTCASQLPERGLQAFARIKRRRKPELHFFQSGWVVGTQLAQNGVTHHAKRAKAVQYGPLKTNTLRHPDVSVQRVVITAQSVNQR